MNGVLKVLWYLNGFLILMGSSMTIANLGFMGGLIRALWYFSGLLMLFFMHKRKVKIGLEGILIFLLGPVSWSVLFALIIHRKLRPNDTPIMASLLALFILIGWAASMLCFVTFTSK